MIRRAWITTIATALLAIAMGHVHPDALAGPPRTQQDREITRRERQLRQGKTLVRRLLRDERLSPEARRQATELQAALDARARMMSKLEDLHRQFLAQHRADLEELESLRKRAFEIDRRLGADRAAMLQANEAEASELMRNSERAVELIEQLRGVSARERREQRETQRDRRPPAD